MVDLGTLAPTATFSTAVAVNASGQVAGYGTTANDAQQHAIRWSAANVAANLNTLGDSPDGYAAAINDAGAIAGDGTPGPAVSSARPCGPPAARLPLNLRHARRHLQLRHGDQQQRPRSSATARSPATRSSMPSPGRRPAAR